MPMAPLSGGTGPQGLSISAPGTLTATLFPSQMATLRPGRVRHLLREPAMDSHPGCLVPSAPLTSVFLIFRFSLKGHCSQGAMPLLSWSPARTASSLWNSGSSSVRGTVAPKHEGSIGSSPEDTPVSLMSSKPWGHSGYFCCCDFSTHRIHLSRAPDELPNWCT